MAVWEKIELYPTLKVEDIKQPFTAVIECVKQVETQYGTKGILCFTAEHLEESCQIFLNKISINNLVDVFGGDDENWREKEVKIGIENSEATLNQNAIVVQPVKQEKIKGKG